MYAKIRIYYLIFIPIISAHFLFHIFSSQTLYRLVRMCESTQMPHQVSHKRNLSETDRDYSQPFLTDTERL